jgi:D-arabinonate dehydratase
MGREQYNMKITRIEVIPLVRKLNQTFEGGTYRIVNRNTLVTRIYTDEGLIGEVFGGDEDIVQEKIVSLIQDHFEPMLLGQDPRNIELLWNKMFFDGGKIDLGNRSIHVLDLLNRGILMQAISAIDMALWDLVGKIYNTPLYQLLGGYRHKVPVIAIGGYYQAGKGRSQLTDEMQHYKELGMTGVKFKVGRVTVAEDIKRVQAAREAAGDDFVIVCDANQGWTPDQAIRFCREAVSLDLGWIEEPVRWYDQLEGLRMVKDSSPIPVTAGQGEISGFGCRDLVLNGCVDNLNVDVTIAGGVTEWKRTANMASLSHVQMAHHEEPQVALHLLAAVPNSLYVEIFPNYERDPMWIDLPIETYRIKDGFMELPDKPGLGMDLNKDVIEKYRAI